MEEKSFKPFISADRVLPELTPVSIGLGIILGIIFGAANAYLGLRIGLTISASIPVAVLSIISLCAALLGIIFMVPLRTALIVEEHGILPFPEGTACAEVLLAGEGLIGILLAVFAIIPLANGKSLLKAINMGGVLGNVGGLIFFALLLASIVFFTRNKKNA